MTQSLRSTKQTDPLAKSDTIAAIATAKGPGGIGIVRISGPNVPNFFSALLSCPSLKPRLATHSDFLAEDGSLIDTGLALYFPAPSSFTGENVLELQGHGGSVVLHSLLNRCLSLGARLAEPGEFTRRAFMNGKLDLAQAESVIDLISAQTELAAKQAIRSLKGEFSQAIHETVEKMTSLRAMIEATFDFAEEDIEGLSSDHIQATIEAIKKQLMVIKTRATQGAILRDGVNVVLIGEPNAGKSSLMNQLADDDIAIVNEIPGTTRDALREHIVINGVPVHIIDTAGLRETEDPLEKAGIARTWSAIERADLALLVVDRQLHLTNRTKNWLKNLPKNLPYLIVYNKIDLTGEAPKILGEDTKKTILVSAKYNQGIDLLRHQLLASIGWEASSPEGLFLARQRHLEAIDQALEYAEETEKKNQNVVLIAESLRLAQQALNRITKPVCTEDLLDEIFSKFCIGK